MSFSSPRPPNAAKELNNTTSSGGSDASSAWALARSTSTNSQVTAAGNSPPLGNNANSSISKEEHVSSDRGGNRGRQQDSATRARLKQQSIYQYFPPPHHLQQQQQQQRYNHGYSMGNDPMHHQMRPNVQNVSRQNARQPSSSPIPMTDPWAHSYPLSHPSQQQQYYHSSSGATSSNSGISNSNNGVAYPFWPLSDSDISSGTTAVPAPTAPMDDVAGLLSSAYFPNEIPTVSPPSSSNRVQFAHHPQQQQQQYASHYQYQPHVPNMSSTSSRGGNVTSGGGGMTNSPLYGSNQRPVTTTTSSVIGSDDGQEYFSQQWNNVTSSVVIEPFLPPVQSGRSSASGSSSSTSSGHPHGSPQLSARRSTSGNDTRGASHYHYGRNGNINQVLAPSRARSGERLEAISSVGNNTPFGFDPPSPPQMMQGGTAHSTPLSNPPPSSYNRFTDYYPHTSATTNGRREEGSSIMANAMPPEIKMPPPLPVAGASSSRANGTRSSSSDVARLGGGGSSYSSYLQQQQQRQPQQKPEGRGSGSATYSSASSSASSVPNDFDRFVEDSHWHQMTKTQFARGASSMQGANSSSTGIKPDTTSIRSGPGSSESDPTTFNHAIHPYPPPPPTHPQQHPSHHISVSSSSAFNQYSGVHNGIHPVTRLAPPPPLPMSAFSPTTMTANRALQMSPTSGLFSPHDFFDQQQHQQQQVKHPGSAVSRMGGDRFVVGDFDDASRGLGRSVDGLPYITTSSAMSDISGFDAFGRTIPWSTGSDTGAQDHEEDKSRSSSSKRTRSSTKANSKRNRPLSSVGEHRLKIKFESMGNLGKFPQKFGRSERYVPDGIRGTHEVYQERWRFEVKHHVRHSSVSVEWIAENLTSGLRVTKKESLEESMARENQGRTICNRVLKEALEARAKELEKLLETSEISPLRAASLRDKIKALRPNRCLVGLLFFGLQHKIVQDHMEALYRARVAEGSVPDSHNSSGNTLAGSDSSASGEVETAIADNNNVVSTADELADQDDDSIEEGDGDDDNENEEDDAEDDGFVKVDRPLSSASSSQTAHSHADTQQQGLRESGRGLEQQAQRLPKSSSSSTSALSNLEMHQQIIKRMEEDRQRRSLRVQTENLPLPELDFTPVQSSSSEDSHALATRGTLSSPVSGLQQRRYRVVEHPLGGNQYKYDIQVSPGASDPRQLPSVDIANIRISSLKPG